MNLDLHSMAIILGLLGGGGLLGLIGKAYGRLKQLDDKQDSKSCAECRRQVDADAQKIRDLVHSSISDMRDELLAELDKRASKAEVIAHAAILAEHSTALAVLRTELAALTASSKRVEATMDKVLDRLSKKE